jgi:predicted lipoprotein
MTSETRQSARRSLITPNRVVAAIGIVVLIAAIQSVKVISIEENSANAPEQFDAVAFAAETYPTSVVPYINNNALDLATILGELEGGADPTDFGNSTGNRNATAIAVSFTAVAGSPTPPVLPLTVDGVASDVTVVLQIGPAMSGTAIRDVTGEISFDQFTNQLEYQSVGTEFNNLVRLNVLDRLDTTAISGKTIQVTGAFLWGNPKFISIIPISAEVLP